MLVKYFPYERVNNVFQIDFQKLKENGFQGVIFDIDQTLVPHGDDATPEIEELFEEIHSLGLKTILLSNNTVERIEAFCSNLSTDFIAMADKPNIKGYVEALQKLQLSEREVVFVGDQIFTDILGANRIGISSILVDYLLHPGDIRNSKKRMVENWILKIYNFQKKYHNRLGGIKKEDS